MSGSSSGASLFAKHPTITGLYVGLTDSTSTSYIDPVVLCLFKNVTPDTTANVYHHGCIALVTSDAGGTLSMYSNTGTPAAPVWTQLNGGSGTFYSSVSALTNGTTLVPLFGTSNPFAGSITSIQVISGSTTSVNVTVSDNGVTEAVIATSTTVGATTGSATFVPFAFTQGGSVNIVNSSALTSGTATVIATFTTT